MGEWVGRRVGGWVGGWAGVPLRGNKWYVPHPTPASPPPPHPHPHPTHHHHHHHPPTHPPPTPPTTHLPTHHHHHHHHPTTTPHPTTHHHLPTHPPTHPMGCPPDARLQRGGAPAGAVAAGPAGEADRGACHPARRPRPPAAARAHPLCELHRPAESAVGLVRIVFSVRAPGHASALC